MPSFPYIDHEWLTNIFLYGTYNYFGVFFTALLHVIFLLVAVYLSIKRELRHIGPKVKIPLMLFTSIVTIGVFQTFFGIRPQVESWLLYSMFLAFILNDKIFDRYFYLLPFFQILWVNIHGSFPLPIITFSIFISARLFKYREIWWKGIATLALCIFATGVNPYGFRIWNEIIQTVTDTSLRWSVVEWRPSFLFFNIFYLVVATLFVFSLKKYLKIFSFDLVVLNIFFFLQGIMSMRHVPIWFLVNIPMQLRVLSDFYDNAGKIKFGRERFIKLTNGAIAVVLVFLITTLADDLTSKNKSLREDDFYPKNAIIFLKENPAKGNVFSDYAWGGYLIWKYSEKKVFIDGRMPSWKWKSNDANESDYVMGEYVDFITGKQKMDDSFKKYDIDTILWPNQPCDDTP